MIPMMVTVTKTSSNEKPWARRTLPALPTAAVSRAPALIPGDDCGLSQNVFMFNGQSLDFNIVCRIGLAPDPLRTQPISGSGPEEVVSCLS